jgi:hypothetical protein
MPTGSSLLRAVEVVIDRASWRAQPSHFRHPFPKALARQRGPFPVHLLEMLLRVGELTTPVLNVQSGVARLWPLLRYLHAIADTPGFRFRAAWIDTERHQKAIASDDLGVGLGMAVLYRAFNYTACVDGRAFLHRLSQLGLLAFTGGAPPKVGIMKMADYAALDSAGKFHLIECKGTQHSAGALASAMADGQLQKRSLVCSSPGAERRLVGQRLVVGAYMVLEGATRDTQVVVMDPAPLAEEPIVLAPRIAAVALSEPALRLEVARAFGTAGAVRTATVIAQSDLSEDMPALTGAAQRDRVREALNADEPELETFEDFGEDWIGERVVVPLLEPLLLDNRVYRYARLTKGVSRGLITELSQAVAATPLFQEQYPGTAERLRASKTITGEDHAAIIRPGVSLSAIELLERRKG